MSQSILVIGNQNYSSWSFRAWLAAKLAGLPFETQKIYIQKPDSKAKILAQSPAGKVPVFIHNGKRIWDSLAIGLYLADQFPHLLPASREDRATAYSIICEFHSGFPTLRKRCTMDMRATHKSYVTSAELLSDIARIEGIWTLCREANATKGPFLFGNYSLADVFFAPVVSRFFTYDIPCNDICQQYMKSVIAEPFYQEWLSEAQKETETITWE